LGTGAVRLAFPRGGRLGLAEGIETALSAIELFGVPCWATLGNERFGLVTIPESVRELHLFVDNDAGGRIAEARARVAYVRPDRRIVTHCPERAG
ncbi:toprim domain-containing protein, partial [Acinetobacter baumannii]